MADPGDLAAAYVTILPDMSKFVEELATELDAAVDSLHPTIVVNLDLDVTTFLEKVQAAETILDTLSDQKWSPKLGLDLSDFLLKVAEAKAMLDALGKDVSVGVNLVDSAHLPAADVAATSSAAAALADTVANAMAAKTPQFDQFVANAISGSKVKSQIAQDMSDVDKILDPNAVKNLVPPVEPKLNLGDAATQSIVANLASIAETKAAAAALKSIYDAGAAANYSVSDLSKLANAPTVLGALTKASDLGLDEAALGAINLDGLGESADAVALKIAKAQQTLASFAKQVASVDNSKLDVDTKPMWASIAEFQAALEADSATMTIHGDILPLLADIALARGALAAAVTTAIAGGSGKPLTETDLLGTDAIATMISDAKMAGVVATIAKAKTDSLLGNAAADTTAGGLGLMSMLTTPNAKAGYHPLLSMGFDAGSVGAQLLGGGGGRLPFLGPQRWLAGMGSVGAMMGFGPEHVIVTGLGLAGSAVGGLAGAGLLGAGALGVGAVGMGTDLAGIGQASGDIKTTLTNMNALSTAVQEYGKNSTQAATAQQTLNNGLIGFSPAARSAVTNASSVIAGFTPMFDEYTGKAEATGANIISSLVKTGEKFLPTIGYFATQNMSIIQKGIAPLESWLSSGTGGLGIFTQMEQMFSGRLPTAMKTLDSAIEVVVKSFGFLSEYTGPMMQKLNEVFTHLNSSAGFSSLESEMGKLIGDFEAWKGLVVEIVRDMRDAFSHDAGTALAIVDDLTNMLKKLNEYENSVSGGTRLSSIFTQHKEQIEAILSILPVLARALAPITAIMPAMVAATIPFINALVGLLTIIEHIPGGVGEVVSALLGMVLVFAKLTSFKTTFEVIIPAIFKAGKTALAATGEFLGLSGAEDAAGASAAGMSTAMSIGLLGVLAGAGLVIYELVKHLGDLEGGLIAAGLAAAGLALAFRAGLFDNAIASIGAYVVKLAAMVTSTTAAVDIDALLAGGFYEEAAAAEVAAAGTATFAASLGVLAAAAAPIVAILAAVAGGLVLDKMASDQANGADQKFWGSTLTDAPKTISGLNDQLTSLKKHMADIAGSPTLNTGGWERIGQGFGSSKAQFDAYIQGSEAIQKVQAEIKTATSNVSDLSKEFKLTKPQVESLAQSLGINLTKSMDPTTIDKFKAGLHELAGTSGLTDSAISHLAKTSGYTMQQIVQQTTSAASAMQSTMSTFTNIVTLSSNAASGTSNYTAVSAANIASGYKNAIAQATQFSAGIAQLAKDGIHADILNQLLTAGPSALGQVQGMLAGVASQTNGSFVSMVNTAQKTLDSITAITVEQSKLMAVAMLPNTSESVTKLLPEAQQIAYAQDAGGKVSEAFVNQFAGGLPALQKVAKEYGLTITGITTSGGGSMTLAQWNKQFHQFILDLDAQKPAVSAAASAIGATVPSQFTKSSSGVGAAASAAGQAAATGLSSKTGAALTAAEGVSNAILGQFTGSFPGKAGAAGATAGQNFVNGVGGAKPKAQTAGTQLMTELNTYLQKSFTSLTTTGKGAGTAAVTGAGNADAKPAGKSIIQGIIDGINANDSKLNSALKSAIDSAVKGAASYAQTQGKTIGKGLDEGLAQGITANAAIATDAAQTAAAKVIAATKGVVKQNSPSLVYMDIGQGLMEGLANGITSGYDTHVAGAIHSVSSRLVSDFKPSLSVASSASSINGVTTSSNTGPVTYSPTYHITGDPDSATLSKLQSFMNAHDTQLLEAIKRR